MLTLIALVALVVTEARATAEYDYKTNERRVIDGGLAPNRKLAISAGLAGRAGPYFFLTVEPSHRVAVRLDGIAPDELLDTAPEALHAIWAPDSGHVAIIFRTERHVLTMWLYGISAQRATRIAVGDLLDIAIKGKALTMDD